MNYDTYRAQYACMECGAEPSVEDYHEWLIAEVARIQREMKRMRLMMERNDSDELGDWLMDYAWNEALRVSFRSFVYDSLRPRANTMTHDFSKVVTDG